MKPHFFVFLCKGSIFFWRNIIILRTLSDRESRFFILSLTWFLHYSDLLVSCQYLGNIEWKQFDVQMRRGNRFYTLQTFFFLIKVQKQSIQYCCRNVKDFLNTSRMDAKQTNMEEKGLWYSWRREREGDKEKSQLTWMVVFLTYSQTSSSEICPLY